MFFSLNRIYNQQYMDQQQQQDFNKLTKDLYKLRQKQTNLSQPLLAAVDIHFRNSSNPFSINLGSGNASDQLVKTRLVAYTLKKLMLIPIKQMDNNMWHMFKHSVEYILSAQDIMDEQCIDMMMDILKQYYKSMGKEGWPRVRVGFSLLEKLSPPQKKDQIYLFRGTLQQRKQFLNWISNQNYTNQKLKDFIEKCKKIQDLQSKTDKEDNQQVKTIKQINTKDLLKRLIYSDDMQGWKIAMELDITKLNQNIIQEFCQFLDNYQEIGLNQLIGSKLRANAKNTLIDQLIPRSFVFEKFMKRKSTKMNQTISLLRQKPKV